MRIDAVVFNTQHVRDYANDVEIKVRERTIFALGTL